jgi:hypothetical protein
MIVGFDTFSGFPSVYPNDGNADIVSVGAYSVTEGYENYLAGVDDFHEQESPIAFKQKYRLSKGDASVEFPRYLDAHPETMLALAYFEFDLYDPTKRCLEAVTSRLTRGSVVGFDGLKLADFPGETRVLQETIGLGHYRIQRSPHSGASSFLVIE